MSQLFSGRFIEPKNELQFSSESAAVVAASKTSKAKDKPAILLSQTMIQNYFVPAVEANSHQKETRIIVQP